MKLNIIISKKGIGLFVKIKFLEAGGYVFSKCNNIWVIYFIDSLLQKTGKIGDYDQKI